MSAENLASSNAALTLQLHKILSNRPGNVFFSPFSLHLTLSMLHQGAQEETAQTISQILQIPDPESVAEAYKSIISRFKEMEVVKLHLANKIYVRKGEEFVEEFGEVMRECFDSEGEVVDFGSKKEAAVKINEWVANKTQNRIKETVSEGTFDEETTLFIINAVYFSAVWKDKFLESDTRDAPFYLDDGSTVQVRMMQARRDKAHYKDDEHLKAEILSLPYKGRVKMVIILPKNRNGIGDLETSLASTNLIQVLSELEFVKVDLALPKFKIESTIKVDAIKELGLAPIFDKNKANFRKMLKLKSNLNICVDSILHKASIDVDEKGSEAAAATVGCMIKPKSGFVVKKSVKFVVDHPSIFAVVEGGGQNTNVLFFGRLSHPKY